MKTVYLIILFFAAGTAMGFGQTNGMTNSVDAILALATTNSPPPDTNAAVMPATRGPTSITALGPAECDLNDHWITYCDHVCVSNADVKLTCEWAKAIFPQNWERPTNIVAETNVVIDYIAQNGERTRATGEKVVDVYQVENGRTNDIVTMTGDALHKPRIEQAKGYFTSDKFIWDRSNGKFLTEGSFEGVGNISPSPNAKKDHAGAHSMETKPQEMNAPPMPGLTNSP